MDKDFHCKCWYDEVIEFVRVVVVSVITRSRVRSLLVVSDVDVIRNSYRSSAQGIPGLTVILLSNTINFYKSKYSVLQSNTCEPRIPMLYSKFDLTLDYIRVSNVTPVYFYNEFDQLCSVPFRLSD